MSEIIIEPPVVIVRSQLGGVHVGDLVELDVANRCVVLVNAHRIWRWAGANTITELALHGASLTEFTRISERCPAEQRMFDVFEVLRVIDPAAIENLRTPRWLSGPGD